jgi:hypothetical protein
MLSTAGHWDQSRVEVIAITLLYRSVLPGFGAVTQGRARGQSQNLRSYRPILPFHFMDKQLGNTVTLNEQSRMAADAEHRSGRARGPNLENA